MKKKNIWIFFSLFVIFTPVILLTKGCKKPDQPVRSMSLSSTAWSLSKYNSTVIPDEQNTVFVFNADGTADAIVTIFNFSRIYYTWNYHYDTEILYLDYDEYKVRTLTDSVLVVRLVTSPYTTMKFNSFKTVYRVAAGVSDLSANSALLHANVRTNKSPVDVVFEYGLTTAYGKTVQASPSYVAPVTKTEITGSVTGLEPGTVYHYRIKVVENSETLYSGDLTFKTYNALKVSDTDKNLYNTITIGSQTWLAENLKTTRYSNGDTIPYVPEYYTYGHFGTGWSDLTTGARSQNTNVANYDAIYGWFYNWFAVNDSRKICPVGWHVPTAEDWSELSDYLGGDLFAAVKLKESGTALWKSPNPFATNETGFSARPGAYRAYSNGFYDPGYYGYWWTSTEYDSTQARYRSLSLFDMELESYYIMKTGGLSVRCIKD